MANIGAIRRQVKAMLNDGLSPGLSYHNLHHTLDVTKQCLAIAKGEGITGKRALEELEISSLYHDTGFLYVYQNHEEKSCEIAREQLPGFGLTEKAIDRICALIMATKVPQVPTNELENIICDADLDYLGRNDFFETGDALRRELIAYKFIETDKDWTERQLIFLANHNYFTNTSRKKRGAAKRKHLQSLSAENIEAKK